MMKYWWNMMNICSLFMFIPKTASFCWWSDVCFANRGVGCQGRSTWGIYRAFLLRWNNGGVCTHYCILHIIVVQPRLFELFGKSPWIFTAWLDVADSWPPLAKVIWMIFVKPLKKSKDFSRRLIWTAQAWITRAVLGFQDSSGKFCGSKMNSSYQDPRGLWVFASDGPFGYLFSAAPKSDGFHWARNIELGWISTPHAKPRREGAMGAFETKLQLVPKVFNATPVGLVQVTACYSNWYGKTSWDCNALLSTSLMTPF